MAKRQKDRTQVFINRNFVIKYKSPTETRFKLTGAGKYHIIVGEELKNKHFKKLLESQAQTTTFLIRNRLIIKFHSK